MSNQSAPIQEVSRLLDLVPYLSTHSHISLKELALEFGISEKAMANELTALSMCGLPGYTPYELIEIFFDSGFVTINNHDTLDIPRALTQLELASLLIGLEILRESAGDNETLISKIDALLVEMKTLMGGVIKIDENPATRFQALISGAIESRSSLSLDYRSPVKDEVTSRKVDPLEIRSERDNLYLVAFCHSAQAVRNFRLDRVEEVTIIGTAEKSHESLTLAEPEVISAKIKVLGDRRSISEALSILEIATSGEAVVEIFSPLWISKAAIAHAPYIELLEPAEVRDSVQNLAENILALYSS
jgi:predicted DNA-binding transcriptional regulator YafY